MRTRLLSYSEIDTFLTCPARWDFRYGGHLAGSALSPKEMAVPLQEGRAWGAAVAQWHAHGGGPTGVFHALDALRYSIGQSVQEQVDAGITPLKDDVMDTQARLARILHHYTRTAKPFPNLTLIEHEIEVPLFSRTGKRNSNRYKFQARIDGYTTDEHGHEWPVEFKLRKRLQAPRVIARSLQPRLYAWSLARDPMDVFPAGIIVEERLNDEPSEVRWVKGKKKDEGRTVSHAMDQRCTPEEYLEACQAFGVEPKRELVEKLRTMVWQQRIPIMLRPSEIWDAGRMATSAAQIVRMLDSGQVEPIRNAKPTTCNFCEFEPICDAPMDALYVETLFDRKVEKRNRDLEPAR